MIENFKKLSEKLNSKFFFNYDVGQLTWFKAGGKAKIFTVVENEHELEIILNSKKNMRFYIIGAGSNLLVRDGGFDGILIKLGKGFNKIEIVEDKIIVGASILDANLSNFARKNLIGGFEFFSGIPGTVGGAIKMNAGCFGSETRNVLKKIILFDNHIKKKEVETGNLKLNYRSSNINDESIITTAEFKINYGKIEDINEVHRFIKKERLNNQPIKYKTSGSTFKNPPNQFAAKLIDLAGCKGLSIGDAIVSDIHSNFLVNLSRAKASDIENLGKTIIEKVYKKFNIILDWEIKIIGE